MVAIIYHRAAHSLTARGHAMAGEKGRDPVCAGVSALVLTLAENVASLVTQGNARRQVLHLEEGNAQVRCQCDEHMEAVVTLIYDAICAGFALLQTLHPEHVSYKVIG